MATLPRFSRLNAVSFSLSVCKNIIFGLLMSQFALRCMLHLFGFETPVRALAIETQSPGQAVRSQIDAVDADP